MDFRGAFNAVTKPFRKPEGYVSAKEEQAARKTKDNGVRVYKSSGDEIKA